MKNKQIIIVVCSISTLILGSVGIWLNFVQTQRLINTKKEYIQVIAEEKSSNINSFLKLQGEKTYVLAALKVFVDATRDPQNQTYIQNAKDQIESLKEELPGIGILNKEGIVIASDHLPIGTDYSSLPAFPITKDSKLFFTLYYDPHRKDDFFAVGAPIFDTKNNNEPLGVAGFDISLSKFNALMETKIKGNQLEAYLTNEEGLLLSKSKHIVKDNKHGVLLQNARGPGIEECMGDIEEYDIKEHEDEVFEYKNYMGNLVYGAHAYAPEILGCIIVEEDAIATTLAFDIAQFINNLFTRELNHHEY